MAMTPGMTLTLTLANKWKAYKTGVAADFYSCISDLLENDMVIALDNYTHHYCFTRLKHSLNVAYASFLLTRFLRWDSRAVARAGLMHDLFFYDRRDEDFAESSHAKEHPKIALLNARAVSPISDLEADIILKHMWLATAAWPRYRESYIVSLMDKCCALSEVLQALFTRSRLRTVYETA